MNCKPGDLAIFVNSAAGNIGRIVRCLRLASDSDLASHKRYSTSPAWVIDPPVRDSQGDLLPFANDINLKPLRDPGDDAKDETLEWLPVPSKELA